MNKLVQAGVTFMYLCLFSQVLYAEHKTTNENSLLAETNMWFGDEELEWSSHHHDAWCLRNQELCQQRQERDNKESFCTKYPERCEKNKQTDLSRDNQS